MVLILLWLIWPVGRLFPDTYSTLVYDFKGDLLRVFLAPDQQYRFPRDTLPLPEKYITAVTTYEDRLFFYHPGINPVSLVKAFFVNMAAGKIVTGGSTIPMQVARLANPKRRTYFNKLIECQTAFKLTLRYSKKYILKRYAEQVPMGGNIVGIQAASQCYFAKPMTELTWAEASLFTVLPNAPSHINLAKKRSSLLFKRNRLLGILRDKGYMDSLSCSLACSEPLPGKKRHLPFIALHATQRVVNNSRIGSRNYTTLDKNLQQFVENRVQIHHALLRQQGIWNCAVLVAETETGFLRAYIGSQDYNDTLHNGRVDGVQAFRSTGSLLKPFLAGLLFDRGPYTSLSLVQDVPSFYGTFAPQNASKQFQGVVTIEQFLMQSLNVPAVRLLNTYGITDLYDFLKASGLKGLFRSPEGYGLTLILGGAEARLWGLVQLYLILGNAGIRKDLTLVHTTQPTSSSDRQSHLLSDGASWQVLNILNKLSRPDIEFYWHQFDNTVPVAWKTGTSYGQKDGWAIGVNREWTIGVWIGNFTGEGNTEIGGAKAAAPLLFSLFNALSHHDKQLWFETPEYDLQDVACCTYSGFPVNPHCPDTIMLKRPITAYVPGTCPFHKRYLIDKKSGKSVCSLCWNNSDTAWVTRTIHSPAVKDILNKNAVATDSIPPHSPSCLTYRKDNLLEIVYPVSDIKILIPRDYDGTYEKLVLSAKHQRPSVHLFWYIDKQFIGETIDIHTMPCDLKPGKHTLTVQDEEGFIRRVSFSSYRKKK